jgi:hypothetical protein
MQEQMARYAEPIVGAMRQRTDNYAAMTLGAIGSSNLPPQMASALSQQVLAQQNGQNMIADAYAGQLALLPRNAAWEQYQEFQTMQEGLAQQLMQQAMASQMSGQVAGGGGTVDLAQMMQELTAGG